jgi:hypothetical protein
MPCYAIVLLTAYFAANLGYTLSFFSGDEFARMSFRVWTTWMYLALMLAGAVPIHLITYFYFCGEEKRPPERTPS